MQSISVNCWRGVIIAIISVCAIKAMANNAIEYQNVNIKAPIINLSANHIERCKTISAISGDVIICGKNLLDNTTLKRGVVLNDNGEEIKDVSSYYDQKIACHGMILQFNCPIQRIYRYDRNNNFVGRDLIKSGEFEYEIPADTYFAQIQVKSVSDTVCVSFKNGLDNAYYEPNYIADRIPDYGTVNIWGNGADEVEVELSIDCKAVIPAVKEYDFWEPDIVTDNYKCTHRGQYSQSIPLLTDSLKYSGFLSTYFDLYVGNYEDGYSVTKENLGLDSGAEVENVENPIYSYVFAPKYYNKTVLLSAGMNTCEASTYFGLAYFIKALMEHSEPGMLALYESTRFVVIPVICPTGISHDPLLYRNANNVRINKNFEYNGSWQYNYDRLANEGKNQYPGPYPDSEIETQILKAWMNKYSGSTFYMDCHSDTQKSNASQVWRITTCICSSQGVREKLQFRKNLIEQFYRNKGYISKEDTPTMEFSNGGNDYPKTPYSEMICGTPALMHEQYIVSTMYGSDGYTNNDDYGIKNYVALIRWYVLIMCRSNAEIILDHLDAPPVTITAKSYSREYGDANPVFEYTSEGAALDGEPEIICEATDTSSVGTYDILVKRGGVTNYNVSYVAGTLTITKAPLNIAAGTYTKKQGDAMPEFIASYEGWKNNETEVVLTKKPTLTTTATSGSEPGTYDVLISGAEALNYNISYMKGTLTVTEADPVTITAKSYSREYGDANPVFEYTSEGTALDGVPEITCEATETSPVGTYDIVVKQGTVTNYNVSYVGGTLTVTKAPLTVSVGNYTREYGQENPEFTLTYGGSKNEEDESVLIKKPIATTDATKDSPVGEYTIRISGGEAQNYSFEYVNGKLYIANPTGIKNTLDKNKTVTVFNLSGQKVLHNVTSLGRLTKGVYIVDGRLMIVR